MGAQKRVRIPSQRALSKTEVQAERDVYICIDRQMSEGGAGLRSGTAAGAAEHTGYGAAPRRPKKESRGAEKRARGATQGAGRRVGARGERGGRE